MFKAKIGACDKMHKGTLFYKSDLTSDTDLKDCISENEAQNQQEEMTYEKLIKSEDFYPHHFELYKEYGQPIRCRSEIEKFHERFGDGYKVYELFPKQVENEGFITYKVIYYCKFKSNIG